MNKYTLIDELDKLISEGRNPNTMTLDQLSTAHLVKTINDEDKKVAIAVEAALPQITKVVDLCTESFEKGGRLIYMGAGTSGRLGVLDAVECRPTFSVPDDMVVGLIAGGERALIHAVEGAEDDKHAGAEDLKAISLSKHDMVIGIAASGRTPYVIGGLHYANTLGCHTACVVCNPNAPLLEVAEIGICVTVGAECLTGSTRMKSGTAQKLVLNTISTASMVKIGKVYQNLMVDVNATNEKLVARATRIVMQATQCEQTVAEDALRKAQNKAKLAILMILTGNDADTASKLLDQHKGKLNTVLSKH
ncbi:N-acetylmuramic acid 6-phosphate etherase [Agaribacter marinus]|uniref:N-acetylmuramic acid 6-phosphate etherase n=1 Tax=Agaribacter marinus TaxID=1431249 RepID=A0AA37T1Y4_9ALTE|nr:N-acetylmuramic acid 6-phosphate etherase [Agaribacter marinus]GLR72435.1 N-acetylmuramic acid 6-phosphate etherase 2 [Agaribacter marinus]